MKKTININLNGQLFTIEEDAYEQLQQYLSSINQYFSKYREGGEILKDIENRMAEKFFDALQRSETKVLTKNEVSALVATMGNVADFEADEANDTEELFVENSIDEVSEPSNKFYRIKDQKIIAGVAKGLAHKYDIDPFWVRLLFLLAVGLAPATDGVSLFGILAYLTAWIAFPVNENYKENSKIKKLYRKSEGKIIGGVTTGLAEYFSLDLGITRFLMIASVFIAGFGIIFYFVVWAITPMAQTMTERMQMSGEAITLENISNNLSGGQYAAPSKKVNSSINLNAILAPFAWLLRKTGTATRWFLGALLVFIGANLIIGTLVSYLAANNELGTSNIMVFTQTPVYMYKDIPKNLIFFGFFTMLAPSIALLLMGLSVLKKQNYFINRVGEVLLTTFVIGGIGTGTSFAKYYQNFSAGNQLEQIIDFKPVAGTPLFDISAGNNAKYSDMTIELVPSKGSEIIIKKFVESDGKSMEEALLLANNVDYKIAIKDSIFILDNFFKIPENVPYRNQKIRLEIKIPIEKPFYIGEKMSKIVSLVKNGYESPFYRKVWDNEQNSESFAKSIGGRSNGFYLVKLYEDGILDFVNSTNNAKNSDKYQSKSEIRNVGKYSSIEISNSIELVVKNGDTGQLEIFYEKGALEKDFRVSNLNGTLQLGAESGAYKVIVTLGPVATIVANDQSNVTFNNFKAEVLSLKTKNQAEIKGNLTAKNLNISAADESLIGDGSIEASSVNLEASNSSSIKLKVDSFLNAALTDESTLEYSGKVKSVSLAKSDGATATKK
jgi:phage shock protein PspC (stress-responsive transcriptional regulator)